MGSCTQAAALPASIEGRTHASPAYILTLLSSLGQIQYMPPGF